MLSSPPRTTLSPSLRGVLLALLGAFLSACYLIPWKLAAQHGDALHATLVLLTSAALFNTLALAPVRSSDAPPLALAPTLKLAAVLSVLTLAGIWFSAESVRRVSGALLAVLQRCDVIIVGLVGPLALRERAQPTFWIGAVVALGGLVVLSTRAGASLGLGPNADPIGALCGLGSAGCIAMIAVLTRKHIHELRPVMLNAVRLWLSVLLWFAVERVLPSSALTPSLVQYAALAAFLGPFLGRLAMMQSARHVAASTTVLASLATPPATLLLGFVVLGTLPSAHELLGGAIMLAGVVIPVVHSLVVDRALRAA